MVHTLVTWCIYMVLFARDCYHELLGFLIVGELHLDTSLHGALESAASSGVRKQEGGIVEQEVVSWHGHA